MSGSDCSSRKVPDENVLRGLGDTAGAADVAAAGVHAHKTTARLRIPTPLSVLQLSSNDNATLRLRTTRSTIATKND